MEDTVLLCKMFEALEYLSKNLRIGSVSTTRVGTLPLQVVNQICFNSLVYPIAYKHSTLNPHRYKT